MTVTVDNNINRCLASYEEFERRYWGDDPSWLRRVRQAAIARFGELGIPTTHDEEWRSTNLASIARTAFFPADTELTMADDRVTGLLWNDASAIRLVVVNGRYAPEVSRVGNVPAGVEVGGLAQMLRESPDRLESFLGRHASCQDHPFVALNTAFIRDGAFALVRKGTAVEQVLHIVYVTAGDGEPIITHPRTLLVVERGAQVRLVETFVGRGEAIRLTNAVVEMVAADDAVVDHYKLAREPANAHHIGTIQVHLGRGVNARSHCLTFGGNLVRHNINAYLAGEGSDCVLNGLSLLDGEQHVDNHIRVDHAAAHCDSREYFKSILDGESHAVFTGRIVVHKDAQKTDAKQSNLNLLLGPGARVDTRPQLEIYADDVKCTHGATVGQLDYEALFYLRSRGLSESAARSLLIHAFANESLERIRVDALRTYAHDALLRKLPASRTHRKPWES